MTKEELSNKATEWIRSQGWSEENLPSDEYVQMCDAYIAGAKENQPNAEEMIKRLLKDIKTGISEVKENLVFHNLIKNPNDLPKNNNKILFFAKDISCLKNRYLNRYSLGNYDTINKLFVANSPGYSKEFVITEVLYWWELAE